MYLAVGVGALAAGIIAFYLMLPAPKFISAGPQTSAGEPLVYDELVFLDTAGRARKLAEWSKPVQIVNFWAPWCAPCRREIPALIELQAAYPDQVQLIGLAFDSASNVDAFREQFNFNYPLLIVQSDSNRLNRFFGNDSGGLPFTAILDTRREIVFRHAGEITRLQLEQQLGELVNK